MGTRFMKPLDAQLDVGRSRTTPSMCMAFSALSVARAGHYIACQSQPTSVRLGRMADQPSRISLLGRDLRLKRLMHQTKTDLLHTCLSTRMKLEA